MHYRCKQCGCETVTLLRMTTVATTLGPSGVETEPEYGDDVYTDDVAEIICGGCENTWEDGTVQSERFEEIADAADTDNTEG